MTISSLTHNLFSEKELGRCSLLPLRLCTGSTAFQHIPCKIISIVYCLIELFQIFLHMEWVIFKLLQGLPLELTHIWSDFHPLSHSFILCWMCLQHKLGFVGGLSNLSTGTMSSELQINFLPSLAISHLIIANSQFPQDFLYQNWSWTFHPGLWRLMLAGQHCIDFATLCSTAPLRI